MMGDPLGALGPLLRQVSRSFWLTLRVLPGALRGPLGLAYLLARSADSVADTRILPRPERLHTLDLFREELALPPRSRLPEIQAALSPAPCASGEGELLARLEECFAIYREVPLEDRRRIQELLLILTHGMQEELRLFPGEEEGRLVALPSRADLDRHTYYAAGCVGAFWTEMAVAHCPALRRWDGSAMARKGTRFGQGLQMTNVLRDLAQDLRIGRCYLPREELAALDLRPEDLLDPAAFVRLRPLLQDLITYTQSLLADGWAYTLAIPRHLIRLRLACAWPLLIGLRTLERLQRSQDLLDPRTRVKISRLAVYGILARTAALAWSDAGLDRYYRGLHGRLEGLNDMKAPGGPDRVRAHVWVSGQVQGVFFRAYAEDEATFRKLDGWIRNAADGRVEAVFEGTAEAVAAMLQWCRAGSPAARVAGVEVTWEAARGERGFRVSP